MRPPLISLRSATGGVVRTADGYADITVDRLDDLVRLLLLTGRQTLLGDPRFRTRTARAAHRAALAAEIARELSPMPTDECVGLLTAAGIRASACPPPLPPSRTPPLEPRPMTADISTDKRGPLAGVKIIELGGIGPGPFCGMLLADLGAEVIRVDRPAEAGRPNSMPVLHRNRRSITVDMKNPVGIEAIRALTDTADAVFEGFRPGVAERLGLGPDDLIARNPRLVYGRMTGWGQDGPLADQAGHDINYIALTGALHAIGPAETPVVPLNLVGDFGGGGMLLALGIVSAVISARATGRGQVVDTAMTDGSATLLAMMYGFMAQNLWTDRRASNLLDGGAPYYGVYRTADDKHMAIGPVEPQFYSNMLDVLGLTDDPDFAGQNDRAKWPVMKDRLSAVFATRTRDEWDKEFDGRNACVAPVLSLLEAPHHPHNAARGTYRTGAHGSPEPAPSPRFSGTPAAEPTVAPVVGAHTDQVLADAGLPADRIAALRAAGAVK
ncbi:CaiB/BaiF CoA transferase family protein [Streptomyces adustus]|uniref:CaiB/BaiF CoA transferase family protein n=1 Tax=Streptomyces adustus TaxID=1609272 RepID=UPI00371B435E